MWPELLSLQEQTFNRPFQKYLNTVCFPAKRLRKHCLQFLLGLTIVRRETETGTI